MRCATPLSGLVGVVSLLISQTYAVPLLKRLPSTDGTYTDSTAKMDAAISCPRGISQKAGGLVLLVSGTGLNGQDSWGNGPYLNLLPNEKPGFDVCWVDPPYRGLGDASVAGEYVAYAIKKLAPQSATKKVALLGHSQGAGLNIPHALIYFPSARALVSTVVGLAPDYHGTTLLATAACIAQNFGSGFRGCSASILQQRSVSNYIKAQTKLLTSAIGPTTVVYTVTDEIVVPMVGPFRSSRLAGSSPFALQDPTVCGPAHLADHLSMTIDPAAYAIAVQAFQTGRAVPKSAFKQSSCVKFSNMDLNFQDAKPSLSYAINLSTAVAFSQGVYSKTEPKLKPCELG